MPSENVMRKLLAATHGQYRVERRFVGSRRRGHRKHDRDACYVAADKQVLANNLSAMTQEPHAVIDPKAERVTLLKLLLDGMVAESAGNPAHFNAECLYALLRHGREILHLCGCRST